MSNYPPGVTGNEIEIAGPSWEGTIERSCDQTDVTIQILNYDSVRTIRLLSHRGRPLEAREIRRACPDFFLAECPAKDIDVDAWAFGGVLHWTCPACSHEYEESE